jgi:hypothetical protein
MAFNPWLHRRVTDGKSLTDDLCDHADWMASALGIPANERPAAFRFAIADAIRDGEPDKTYLLQEMSSRLRLFAWEREVSFDAEWW